MLNRLHLTWIRAFPFNMLKRGVIVDPAPGFGG